MLRLTDVAVRYGGATVLADLSLEVPEGHIVSLLGVNGAGKSTTLKAISGLLGADGGWITHGSVEFLGRVLTHRDPADVVRLGILHVVEGRRVFQHLTVEENLMVGGHTRRRRGLAGDIARVYEYFPELVRRRRGLAGYLSGGEQQMLAIGRALMARPRLLLLDEPSLGLAPRVVQQVFALIRRINRVSGTTILLVEQNAHLAMQVADYAYVLDAGQVTTQGRPSELRRDPLVRQSYLGPSEASPRSLPRLA
jgi:branched-chain amino acid transport system ATP-binding protein